MKLSLVLTASLVAIASCGGSDPAFTIETSTGATTETLTLVTQQSILERLERAPHTTPYRGSRLVTFRVYDDSGVAQILDYTEDILADGSGRCLISTREVREPAMNVQDQELFLMGQDARSDFYQNHRDFQIRDLRLFSANYHVYSAPVPSEVAGRPCTHMEIHPASGVGGHFALDVDFETAVILCVREFDELGRVVSEMMFESFEYGPLSESENSRLPRSTQNWREPNADETLDNFTLNAPRILPEGFRKLDTRIVRDPLGQEWFEMIFGDGVQEMFIFFPNGEEISEELLGEDEVSVYTHGAWTVADGLLRGQRVIALGKLPQKELMLALESCL